MRVRPKSDGCSTSANRHEARHRRDAILGQEVPQQSSMGGGYVFDMKQGIILPPAQGASL